jgi:hypothetical protein
VQKVNISENVNLFNVVMEVDQIRKCYWITELKQPTDEVHVYLRLAHISLRASVIVNINNLN